ncbi:hypothetical protein D3C81_1123900 [compost metagenome]
MVHFDNRLADLGDTPSLFVGGRGDFRHDVTHVGDRQDDLLHGIAGVFHQRGAGLYPVDRLGNQSFDLFCCLGTALCQIAYLAGDHREATALFAGTRSFHCRIQRQNVGLEGNAVDQGGNFGDPLRTAGNIAHGADHAFHQFAALLGRLRGIGSQLIGMMGVFGVLLHRGGQLFHAGGGFFHCGRLLFGA